MSCSVMCTLGPVNNQSSLTTTDHSLLDQVYKVVVEWSNGTSTVIYRRYSMFFDFLVSENVTELVCTVPGTYDACCDMSMYY